MATNPTGRPNAQTASSHNKTTEYSDDQIKLVAQNIIMESVNGELPRGKSAEIARKLSMDHRFISRTLAKIKKKCRDPTDFSTLDMSLILSQRGKRGRQKVYDRATVQQELKTLPPEKRACYRTMATSLGISSGTLHAMDIKRASIAAKPTLTEENRMKRMAFALDELTPSRGPFPRFWSMYDRIHVDEKWFYLKDVKQKVYLADDEEQPNYTVRHKSHIPKIMFLCAVARPRYVPTIGKWWDGKLGIGPLAHQVPAKINSKNRPKGTLLILGYIFLTLGLCNKQKV